MATATQVERAIRSMMKRLDNAAPGADAIPDRSILCVVTDLDVGYVAELRESRMTSLKKSETDERTDVRISASSDDLIDLMEGRLNLATAFLTGRVRVDASPMDLLRIRRLF